MEIGVRVIGGILLLLDTILAPIWWLMSIGISNVYHIDKETSKPNTDKLQQQSTSNCIHPVLQKSATKLAESLRKGEITSEKLVSIFIARVRDVEPLLNAVVEERFEEALKEAKKADLELDEARSKGSEELAILAKNKPFLGIPITIKESCSVKGMSLSVGFMDRAGVTAVADGLAVSLMRVAGAIPMLITNTPELCLGWESTNLLRGSTNNPYNIRKTSGGSSGGEAALISSQASVIGIGSDIAGSIRLPAMFTGIFGHKPTPGLVPIEGHCPSSSDKNFAQFLTIGPMTRYSEDLEPMLRVLAGGKVEELNLDKPVDFKNLKIKYMHEAGQSVVMLKTDKEVKKALMDAVEYLQNECLATVNHDGFPEMEESVEMSISVFFGLKDLPNLLKDSNNPKRELNLYWEIVKSMLGMGTRSLQGLGFTLIQATNLFIPQNKSSHYHQKAYALKKKMEDELGTSGVFIYPTFPVPAFYHNQVFTKTAGVMYTMIFNILGLPSTNVPLGLHSNGMPIGVQIVAAPYQDRLCLAVARELEKKFGGWVPPKLLI